MPLFLCRWPNGDCAVVSAGNRDDAIVELDQGGNVRIGSTVTRSQRSIPLSRVMRISREVPLISAEQDAVDDLQRDVLSTRSSS